MDFKKYIERISLPSQAAEIFWRLHSRCGDAAFGKRVAECFVAYNAGDEAFGAYLQDFAAAEGMHPEEINLYIYLRLSERTWNYYQEKGISEDVFYACMRSMAGCCELCYNRLGIYGIDQVTYRRWQRYVLDGTLFRLGRLEFQLKTLDMDIEIDSIKAPAGTVLLSVHIPRNLPLTEEACEKSYDWARKFFREHFGMERCIFICGSWLLHPWMQEVLPETSAIIRFQKTFQLLSVEQNVTAAINWIFPGCADKDISEFPTDTSLRRAAIAQIKAGKPIGTALGVRL